MGWVWTVLKGGTTAGALQLSNNLSVSVSVSVRTEDIRRRATQAGQQAGSGRWTRKEKVARHTQSSAGRRHLGRKRKQPQEKRSEHELTKERAGVQVCPCAWSDVRAGLAVADPTAACTPFAAGKYTNQIVLVDRGECEQRKTRKFPLHAVLSRISNPSRVSLLICRFAR